MRNAKVGATPTHYEVPDTEASNDDLEQRMNDAWEAHYQAGQRWQVTSIELLEAKILEQFPTAHYAELTVIIDESYMEHSIRIFDRNGRELTQDVDFPPEGDESWWLTASEGAVFGEGERTNFYVSNE